MTSLEPVCLSRADLKWEDSEIPRKIAGPEKYAFLAFNTKSNRKNKDFTRFVFPRFSRLTLKIGYFRPQFRIPHEKLCI